jgi:hypothetical protein
LSHDWRSKVGVPGKLQLVKRCPPGCGSCLPQFGAICTAASGKQNICFIIGCWSAYIVPWSKQIKACCIDFATSQCTQYSKQGSSKLAQI